MKTAPLPRIARIPGGPKPYKVTGADIVTCNEKIPYKTEAAAARKGMKVYQCPVCDLFHCTTDHEYNARMKKAMERNGHSRF